MDFSFENLGTNTYLVYQIKDSDAIDSMSLGMLTNNSISGFAAASFMQMDTEKYIKYNVSAKVSAKQLFSGPVNKKRLIGVISGVVDAMLSAEDYMLDPSSILLDMDYIFADVTSCETVVVCLPIMNAERRNADLCMFFKNIIFNTQFDQTENCDHVAQILNYLNSNPVLSLTDFKDLLDKVAKSSAVNSIKTGAAVVAEPVRTVTAQERIQPTATSQTTYTAAVTRTANIQPPQQQEERQLGANNSKTGTAAQAGASSVTAGAKAEKAKPMSMFYLLQHYNKENAAIYKAQQEAKKEKKNAASPAIKQEKPAQTKKSTKTGATGFAVPGKEEPIQTSFEVPNQKQQVVSIKQAVAPQMSTESYQSHYQQNTASAQQQTVPSQISCSINFGETTVLDSGVGATTVLGVAAMPCKNDPHLVRTKNSEKIPLNKPVFRIGKERSYVDYFISDNTAISRGHANFVDHSGEFFVVDTNSTNHTYVNGAMIQPGVETKLSHGDKVRLANEDFEFRMF